MSSLLWVDDLCLEEALFFLVFPVICYFHQIVMISVIKLCRVVDLADLHGFNVLAIILVFFLVFSPSVAILTRFLFFLWVSQFFMYRWVLFFLC